MASMEPVCRFHRSLGDAKARVLANLQKTIASKSRDLLILCYFAALPLDLFIPTVLPANLQGQLSIPAIVGLPLMVVAFVTLRQSEWAIPPIGWIFFSFIGMLTATMLLTSGGWPRISAQWPDWLMFVVLINLFRIDRKLGIPLVAFVCSSFAVSLWPLTHPDFNNDQRLVTFGYSQNVVSMTLMIGAIGAWGLAHFRANRRVIAVAPLWGMAVAIAAMVALSGSRGMTAAMVAGTLAMSVASLRSLNWRNLIVVAALAGALALTFLRSDVLLDRWTDSILDGNTSHRDAIFSSAIEMIAERPVLGWGAQAEPELAARADADVTRLRRSAHNSLIATALFGGLVTTVPYGLAFGLVGVYAWKARKGSEGALPFGIFVSMLVGNMSSGDLPDKIQWGFLAYICGSYFTRMHTNKGLVNASAYPIKRRRMTS
jgi:O-antigen ligase